MGFCKIKKEDVFNAKIAATVMYAVSFLQLGAVLSALGPIFIDLVDQTSTEMRTLSFVFPARSVAYLIGSGIGGPAFDRFDGNKILVVALFITGIGTLSIPFTNSLWLLMLCASVQGLAMGFLDTGGNLMLMYIHGDKVSPYLQSIHLAFGVGALVSPLFIELSRSITDSYYWAFWGMSATFAISATLFMFVKKVEKRVASTEGPKKMTKFHWPLVAIGAILLCFYVGCEVATGGYIFTYAVDKMGFTESQGDFVNALFWGTLTFGRFIAIPISVFLSPGKMLIINYSGSILALAIMFIFSSSHTAFWIGVGVYGLCMASTYPCVMSLVEQSISLTGKSTSFLVVGGAFGEMVLPLSIATIFSAEEPVWEAFTGVQLACLAVSLIFLFVFFFMDRKKNNFIERSFVQLNLTNEFEEEGEEEDGDGDNNESLAMVQIKLKDQKVDIEKSQDDEIDQEDLELGQNKSFNYKQLENDDENENEDDDFAYMNSTEKIKLKD